jgi:hypothetical protein
MIARFHVPQMALGEGDDSTDYRRVDFGLCLGGPRVATRNEYRHGEFGQELRVEEGRVGGGSHASEVAHDGGRAHVVDGVGVQKHVDHELKRAIPHGPMTAATNLGSGRELVNRTNERHDDFLAAK